MPVTVNPADTVRGFVFLVGMSLLYGAAFREFEDAALAAPPGRHRGPDRAFVMTLVALVQAASPEPTRIYGIWKPEWDWGVFGPYVSRNHFAGYMVLAIPVAVAFTAESALAVGRPWRRGASGGWRWGSGGHGHRAPVRRGHGADGGASGLALAGRAARDRRVVAGRAAPPCPGARPRAGLPRRPCSSSARRGWTLVATRTPS